MAEILISQIDVLVHPDHHLVYPDRYSLRSQPGIREAWNREIDQLATIPGGVLLYFPAISLEPDFNPSLIKPPRWGENLEEIEAERCKRYANVLGDRFFQFGTWSEPSASELFNSFNERNLRYDPRAVRLFAFGEYLELCVTTLQINMERELEIPANHSHQIPDLSVSNARGGRIIEKMKQRIYPI